jgi:hypothetical protein
VALTLFCIVPILHSGRLRHNEVKTHLVVKLEPELEPRVYEAILYCLMTSPRPPHPMETPVPLTPGNP